MGFFVPGQTRDLALTVRRPDGSGSLMLFRLAGKRLAAPQVMPLPAGIPAAAVMTTGDVNGDFHDELVFFGAGAADGDSRLVSYFNNNGTWEVEKTWDGTLSAKGAQLSCGDVDGDGIAEPVALTGATATITTFDCDGDTVAASSKPGASIGIPSLKCRLGVADMTGDARADLVTLQPKGSTRSTLRVAISNASGFSPATFWSGKGACARCRFSCAASMPVRVHDDVHTLSVETVAAIVSTTTNSQTVTFSGAPADVVSLEQGDVVLAEPAALIPDGVMRKVDSVETANGQTVLTTTPATLEDVYLQAEIDVRAPMEAQPVAARRVAGRLNQCQGGPGKVHAGQHHHPH